MTKIKFGNESEKKIPTIMNLHNKTLSHFPPLNQSIDSGVDIASQISKEDKEDIIMQYFNNKKKLRC
jgi:hypothetical protein